VWLRHKNIAVQLLAASAITCAVRIRGTLTSISGQVSLVVQLGFLQEIISAGDANPLFVAKDNRMAKKARKTTVLKRVGVHRGLAVASHAEPASTHAKPTTGDVLPQKKHTHRKNN
jgi:hypothetical protein